LPFTSATAATTASALRGARGAATGVMLDDIAVDETAVISFLWSSRKATNTGWRDFMGRFTS
jgi:hypothetical protein